VFGAVASSGSGTPLAAVPGLVLKAACSPGCCQLAEGETVDLLPSLNSRLSNAVGGADANPPVLDGFFVGLGIGACKAGLQRAQQKRASEAWQHWCACLSMVAKQRLVDAVKRRATLISLV